MAETTAQNLIVRALQEIGIYGASEPVASQDAQLALDVLNDMMDVWSNEPQACYTILEQSAPLVPGKASYQIGIGAPDFNMTRPLNIMDGPGSAYTTDTNGNTYPMEVVQRDKFNMYANRSSIINSNFPSVLFYDPQFPYGVINVLPFPNIAYTMFWDSYLQLQEFPTLTTAISLPPGYNAAIRHNLAVELWPFFGSGELDKTVIFMASRSLGSVKRTNGRTPIAIYDPEIVSRAKVSYNPYSDSPGNVVR
jgi:hypothetical protein